MKTKILLILFFASACSSTQVNQAIDEASRALETGPAPTSDEVNAGLKEALMKGISAGADQVSVTDGYYKNMAITIPFPPEFKKVEQRLRQIGLNQEVDRFVMAMNRGAEDAAREAKPIFVDAIKAMTIEDAWGILKGQPDAATQYLKRTTSQQIKEKFKPIIQNSLDKVSATKYYGEIVHTYNKIPFVEKVNPDLNDYTTDLAMRGLFFTVAAEERKIRDNPVERTSDLLKKVFAYQK
jgi:hypothetical protein